MPGVSRDNDTAGGDLIPSQTTVFANDEEVIVSGDGVEGHGSAPHIPQTISSGVQSTVSVGGINVVVEGDDADICLHLSTGSNTVRINSNIPQVEAIVGAPLNIDPAQADDVVEGLEAEEAAGTDTDTVEAVEYGDGGIATGDGNYNTANTSPVNGVAGAQDANAETEDPSPQPSNENGQYINWLPHVDSRVKPQVVANLETLSQTMGFQLSITSGYRSPAYNKKVGGAKKSQHVQGNAVDVVQTGLTTAQRQQFIQAAIDAGFKGIGIYNTFTHLDISGKRAWGSNGSRSGLPKYPWAQTILGQNGYATS